MLIPVHLEQCLTKQTLVSSHFALISILGCPIVKKRKLEEAEAEENPSAPKRRNQPAKQAADKGFGTDSDAADEDEEQKEEEDEDLKDKTTDKTKSRPESVQRE